MGGLVSSPRSSDLHWRIFLLGAGNGFFFLMGLGYDRVGVAISYRQISHSSGLLVFETVEVFLSVWDLTLNPIVASTTMHTQFFLCPALCRSWIISLWGMVLLQNCRESSWGLPISFICFVGLLTGAWIEIGLERIVIISCGFRSI